MEKQALYERVGAGQRTAKSRRWLDYSLVHVRPFRTVTRLSASAFFLYHTAVRREISPLLARSICSAPNLRPRPTQTRTPASTTGVAVVVVVVVVGHRHHYHRHRYARELSYARDQDWPSIMICVQLYVRNTKSLDWPISTDHKPVILKAEKSCHRICNDFSYLFFVFEVNLHDLLTMYLWWFWLI